ncbi:hypothetical protein EJF36_09035 [Bacillus sp. HMF5848]|uniref:YlqD family protein n=1 Tax=Bacillus sp. HMF5848 TaxID=2495421 RepID=UPI000F7B96B3|nr:YlqD family protein [Bacillus sp. HMF5848]RSK27005.1 hypothetical protein EJF36_09035 [Bacillus sp. HMF5848]
MQIMKKVVVKQLLTEQSKQKLLEKYTLTKELLHKECGQLQFELKKTEKSRPHQITHVREYFKKEIQDRQEKIDLLEFQMEQLHTLPLGSEIKEQELDAIINVSVGDNWPDLNQAQVIVVKDGIIVEIR